MDRVVLHVDMDAFYASVEVRDDPRLRGRPVVVGADPQGGRGRGVVCTASYEARAFGIRSAMPISQAWRAAPHAHFLRPDFRRYAKASGAVMAVLAAYADELEVLGLDEAYLDVTARVTPPGGAPDWALVRSLALSLQAAVRRATGLSCSVGAGPSKSVAKVASDRRKPHGVTVVPPPEAAAFLEPLPPGKLNGCGPKTAAALAGMGIRTIGELARTPPSALEQAFGSHGAWLWRLANGDDPRRVDGQRGERKSRGSETTFPRDEPDPARVLEVARGLLEELLDDQARAGRAYATLTVKLRTHDFATRTRARTLAAPALARDPARDAEAAAVVRVLLQPMLDGRPVRLVGVRLSGFGAGGQRSLAAFGAQVPEAGTMGGLLPRHGIRGAMDPGGLRWQTLRAFA